MKHHLQFLWLTCRFLCSIFHNLFIPQPMKRLLFLLLCAISLSLQAQSPHYIWGKVIDAFTYEPLDSVHVSILSKDSTLITQFQTKQPKNMTFTSPIKLVKNGTYIFRFSKAGYKDTYQNFRIKSLKNRSFSTDVGIVKLDKKNLIHMKEVAVNATMVRMVYKGDTLVYNAAFKTAQGSMLDRLIAMLPGFELHPNGQIFVNGRQVSSLLINGEDFFKGKPSVALNNLPAYMVDKVKVYEKMSDRDKALGMDKTRYAQLPLVVDVNLKKEYSIGWIANATAGYGTDNHYVGKAFALRFSPAHVGPPMPPSTMYMPGTIIPWTATGSHQITSTTSERPSKVEPTFCSLTRKTNTKSMQTQTPSIRISLRTRKPRPLIFCNRTISIKDKTMCHKARM